MRAKKMCFRASLRGIERRRPVYCAIRASVVLALGLAPGIAGADPLVIDGTVPNDALDHFFLDFQVPPGTKEIEIKHDDKSGSNILDWGLLDQRGYRGWGGGTTEPIVIGEKAASRAYVPGPIVPGTWRVVVGKAKIASKPAPYHVEIELRTAPTLPVVPRRPYAPVPALATETRYYAGDLHVHSLESTDAAPTLAANIALAKQRGLDFIEISDHNTITQIDFFDDLQAAEPSFLLVPGIEYTTYAGHANAIGATQWVDHKIGQPGVTIDVAADQIAAQGAIFSINHPTLDLDTICIGCAWRHTEIDTTKVHGVEIESGGYTKTGSLFSASAIAFWEMLLDRGLKVPALGGSDDHHAGVVSSSSANPLDLESPIGSPTTLVRATELSVSGILEGIRKGATVVKLDGPTDPMAELEVGTIKGSGAPDVLGYPGDSLRARSLVLRVRVTGTPRPGETVRFVKNGSALALASVVDSDPFVLETIIDAPAKGEDRYRAEVRLNNDPRTITSYVWLARDPNGPVASDAPKDDGGCATTPRSTSPLLGIAALVALVATGSAALRRRR